MISGAVKQSHLAVCMCSKALTVPLGVGIALVDGNAARRVGSVHCNLNCFADELVFVRVVSVCTILDRWVCEPVACSESHVTVESLPLKS